MKRLQQEKLRREIFLGVYFAWVCAAVLLVPDSSSLSAQTTPPAFMFTEIMYNLEGSDAGREWVEVVNAGSVPVTITNEYRFFDDSYHILNLIQGTSTIHSGGVAVVADDGAGWLGSHAGFAGTVFDTSMSLRNSTGTVAFAENRDAPLFAVALYDSQTGGAGNGKTLERSVSGAWVESAAVGGTPGVWSGGIETGTADDTESNNTSDPATDKESHESNGGSGSTGSWQAPPVSAPGQPESVDSEDAPAPGREVRVRISELYPNPVGDDDNEWIELVNEGAFPASLAGWKIKDGSGHVYVFAGGSEAVVLNRSQFFAIDKSISKIALNNSGGEVIFLLDTTDSVRDTVVITDTVPEGESWAIVNGAWQWSTTPTPGARNAIPAKNVSADEFPARPLTSKSLKTKNTVSEKSRDDLVDASEGDADEVAVTEILPNPEGSDGGEWVEVKNTGSHELRLDGWMIDDDNDSGSPFVIPFGTIIAAGEYLIMNTKPEVALNNTADSVRLMTPQGRVLQDISYTRAPNGESYSLDEENEEWFWGTPTPGAVAANIAIEVMGEEIAVVDSREDLLSLAPGEKVQLRGIVVVAPAIIGTKTVYVALDADVLVHNPVPLVELYQHQGAFHDLAIGDRVTVEGEVSAVKDRVRVKLIGSEAVFVANREELPIPEAVSIDEMTPEDDYSWATVQGTVGRIGAKSFSVVAGEISIAVHPVAGFRADGINLVRGSNIAVTGLYRATASRLTLTMLRPSDAVVLQKGGNVDGAFAESNTATSTIFAGSASETPSYRIYYILAMVPAAALIGLLAKKYLLPKIT